MIPSRLNICYGLSGGTGDHPVSSTIYYKFRKFRAFYNKPIYAAPGRRMLNPSATHVDIPLDQEKPPFPYPRHQTNLIALPPVSPNHPNDKYLFNKLIFMTLPCFGQGIVVKWLQIPEDIHRKRFEIRSNFGIALIGMQFDYLICRLRDWK
jgi:hypothetical protein